MMKARWPRPLSAFDVHLRMEMVSSEAVAYTPLAGIYLLHD